MESGLAKMLVIGLGKHNGAASLHRTGTARFDSLIPQALQVVLASVRVVGGLAVLENRGGGSKRMSQSAFRTPQRKTIEETWPSARRPPRRSGGRHP